MSDLRRRLTAVWVLSVCLVSSGAAQSPLPSWNDTGPKKAIVAFVNRVTRAAGPDYVAPAERIATFDNDGTLWSEQPIYFSSRL